MYMCMLQWYTHTVNMDDTSVHAAGMLGSNTRDVPLFIDDPYSITDAHSRASVQVSDTSLIMYISIYKLCLKSKETKTIARMHIIDIRMVFIYVIMDSNSKMVPIAYL